MQAMMSEWDEKKKTTMTGKADIKSQQKRVDGLGEY